jgi:hypothetical protein
MKKYVIICGPVLKEHDSQILKLIEDAEASFNGLTSKLIVLPEKDNGAEQVRELIRKHIEWKYPTIVVTRYDHAVSEFCLAVARKEIKANQFVVRVVQYAEGHMDKFYVTDHSVNSDGFLEDWPYGVLGY